MKAYDRNDADRIKECVFLGILSRLFRKKNVINEPERSIKNSSFIKQYDIQKQYSDSQDRTGLPREKKIEGPKEWKGFTSK